LKGFSLEVRVGLLLLVAASLMGGFLFVLGGISLKSSYRAYVDFDNPGDLKPGASLRIAGVQAGSVESIQYLGGKLDPQSGRRPLVRVTVKIYDEVRQTIHQDARFYVTSSGILGESYLALEPGSDSAPVLAEGSLNVGADPPRLDQALAMGYELLDTMVTGVRENREELTDLFHSTGGMIKSVHASIGDQGTKLDALVDRVETMSADGTTWLQDIRRDYVEGPKIKRVVDKIDHTMQEVSPIAKAARASVNDLFGAEQRSELKSTIHDVADFAERSNGKLDDAHKVLSEMNRGEGTAGALLTNVEMADDFQEMLHDLKERPWKLFWSE
jgi:phospholipid/cholesterol/gamma-HCH transport system substrate-binding protein